MIKLPDYPCVSDMWDILAKESRPILVYGMGNGADKLIERFNKYGIKIADFFASDGFVRGHSFHGYRVKSFSEVKETYDDFVIVLSFASNKSDVIDMLFKMEREYDMFVPDMPVAGVEEYFDRDFYNSHYSEIRKTLEIFADEKSKEMYASIINYKLSGRLSYLAEAYSETKEIYSLFVTENIETIIDAGAYNGDTIREAKEYFLNLKNVIAIEPDRRNFKKLAKYTEAETKFAIRTINAAAWCNNTDGAFSDSGNRNSTLTATASFEHKETSVSLIRLDSIECEKIDYIKYDVEGAEYEALVGSEGLILHDNPALLVSLYHRSRDIFTLPLYLHEKYPFYKFYLRRKRCIPAWEIDLILVKE